MRRAIEVSKECFNTIFVLRALSPEELPASEKLYDILLSIASRLPDSARAQGFDSQEAELISYALIAYIDESVLRMSTELRDFWLPRMLQLKWFNTNTAGKKFFLNVDMLRFDKSKRDVLSVYYLCMLFGFRGELGILNSDARVHELMSSIHADLIKNTESSYESNLHIQEKPNEKTSIKTARNWLGWIALGIGLSATILYMSLRTMLDNQVDYVINEIEILNQEIH